MTLLQIKIEDEHKYFEFSKCNDIYLPTLWLVALQILVYRYTGEEKQVIGYGENNKESVTFLFDFAENVSVMTLLSRINSIVDDMQDLESYYLTVTCGEHIGTLQVDTKNDIPSLKMNYSEMSEDAIPLSQVEVHYQNILNQIFNKFDESVCHITCMGEAEERKILIDWNNTRTEYPRDRTLGGLFVQQAEQTPDAVALICGNESMTYRELNKQAAQLAHYLRKQGVGEGEFVGVLMNRSLDQIIAILAIVQAGAVYVPLDPAYPDERLEFMAKDASFSALITTRAQQYKLLSLEILTICIDEQRDQIAGEPTVNIISQITADSLAYVIYTSGSTGLPKGVAVPHRGVIRLVKRTNYVHVSEDDVMLQCSSVSFDAATFEIWGSLLNGARLVIFPQQASLEALGSAIVEHRVTTLFLTTGLLHQMIDYRLDDLRGLRQLLTGGDVLSATQVKKVLMNLPGVALINGYGPTENTTFTCCYRMTHPDDVHTFVPIGRPISNTSIYVLDRHMLPVPVGVAGELYTGGDGLAVGYLNRQDLTQERFVPQPFNCTMGDRLYKTGDLVRYLPNGTLQFLGRIDDQVKIRGYRVEVGEVAFAIQQHPAVRDAVVTVREDQPGDKCLVAYFIGECEQSEIAAYVGEKLPPFMIPFAFMKMDSFPLTPNGKVDRKALPAPTSTYSEDDLPWVNPRTDTEVRVSKIWNEVLGREQISVEASFFQLGGHSLLATRVLTRIHKEWGVKLAFELFFEKPTIRGLSSIIEEMNASKAVVSAAKQIGQSSRRQSYSKN